MNKIRQFILISRPLILFFTLLTYSLGAGVARYLGEIINWSYLFIVLSWVILIELSTFYIYEYFSASSITETKKPQRLSGGIGIVGLGDLSRNIPLIAGLTALTIAASITVLIFQFSTFSLTTLSMMMIFFISAIILFAPPMIILDRGYGEVIVAVMISNFVPALGFLFQSGELHRLLAMTTFPLTFLQLAMYLAFELPDYATDIKLGRDTLMVRVGWEFGMRMHNYFILLAYLILGIALALGLPLSIGIPGLLTLPLGLFQIWYMNRIASGSKPNWNLLLFVATAVFGLTTYLLTFSLWTR
jgi:1,4-dihydroxy-2-naphthoate octaprenyltransferase